jgi:hypothetical protein
MGESGRRENGERETSGQTCQNRAEASQNRAEASRNRAKTEPQRAKRPATTEPK